MSDFIPADIPNGRTEFGGKVMMGDGKGGFTPVELIKTEHLLEDELVRKVLGFWVAASEQIGRLKSHTIQDIEDFMGLLAQEHGTTPGGKKGNVTFHSVDGLYKVEVRINDHIDFGPELQVAKQIVDECLTEWTEDARSELRAVVSNAFNTDKAGKVNRAELIKLTRLDIKDERWQRGMNAIKEAQRVIGSRQYIRCYQRESFDAPWHAVSIDMAKA